MADDRNSLVSQWESNAFAPTPSAPPISIDYPDLIPPSPDAVPQPPVQPWVAPQPVENIIDQNVLTVYSSREWLEKYVKKTWWRRRGLAETLDIRSIKPSNAYHIQLETFVEVRRVERGHRPYRGGPIDDSCNGPPPHPWGILAQPPVMFHPHTFSMPLPHTDEVHKCGTCIGAGVVTCLHCTGTGRKSCVHCSGTGHLLRTGKQGHHTHGNHPRHDHCPHCKGGHSTCMTCRGGGRITCSLCDGTGQLVRYSKLLIIWTNRKVDRVTDSKSLPPSLTHSSRLRDASGTLLLNEEGLRLFPTEAGTVPRVNDLVNEVSNSLIVSSIDPNVLLHRQRLSVRGVPVYELPYFWKGEQLRFWVYGTEREVYAPNYPLSIARIAIAIFILLVLIGGIIALAASKS